MIPILARIGAFLGGRGAVARARRQQEVLLALLDEAVVITDVDGVIRYCSSALEDITGYRGEDRHGRSIFELLHPDDAAANRAKLARAVPAPGSSSRHRVRLYTRDGDTRVLEVTGTNLLHEPAVKGLVFTIDDVTAETRAQEEAAERARGRDLLFEVYRAAAEPEVVQSAVEAIQRFFGTWSAGVWFANRDGSELLLSGAALAEGVSEAALEVARAMYGAVPVDSELPAAVAYRERRTVVMDIGQPDVSDVLRATLESLGATSITAIPVLNGEKAMGALVFIMSEHRALKGSDLGLLQLALGHLAAMVENLDLRHREDERLVELRMLGAALDRLDDGVIILDMAGRVRSANAAIERVLGYRVADIVGQPFTFASADSEGDEALFMAHRGQWSGERPARRADGTIVPVMVTAAPVHDETGEQIAVLVLVHDLTLERVRQRQMIDADRLATVGALAAGVAHEVNNPLSAIANLAEALSSLPLPADALADLESIKSESQRAGRVVRGLLRLSRQTAPERVAVEVREAVLQVIGINRFQFRAAGVTVGVTVAAGTPSAFADPQQLHQILLNLLTNARQAVAEAGAKGAIRVHVKHEEPNVVITVDDSGPGIRPEVLQRMFRPFYSTKAAGRGTGLGLAVARELARQNGGDLHADNWGWPAVLGGGPGEGGARLVLVLPAALQPVSAEAPAVSGTAPQLPSSYRCLIVEDEPAVARSLEKILRRFGCTVAVAFSAEQALEWLGGGARYDVILSDLHMPGLGGIGFYQRLRAEVPDQVDALVFTSGDVATESTHRFLLGTGRPLLPKPYTVQELRAAIDQVTGAAQPG